MDKNIIIGKDVICYLDGGWQLTGVVKVFEDRKLVLESEGSLSIIFREKIICMTVKHEAADQNSPADSNGTEDHDSSWPRPAWSASATNTAPEGRDRRHEPQEQGSRFGWGPPQPKKEQGRLDPFPSNGISYEDSPMSIPSGILGTTDVDDFSIAFSDSNTRLEFGIEDDTSDES